MDILFQILCNEQTLRDAWLQVKQKNAVGGIDGMSVADFEKEAEKQIRELSRQLKAKTWIPEPYLRVEIPKKDSEKRKLGLLAVRDKIVQQAIKNLIEPYFEKIFLNNSYGYRPGKGHARAIKRTMSEFRMKKNNWVLQLDIDNYFDTIDHDILFQKVQKLVQDEEIVRLIALCVRMGVVNKKFQWNEMSCGVPQGAVLSPLLANLYLHAFDQFITSKVESYVRYADDFLIFCEKREQAEKVLKQAAKFLTEQLLLKLNEPVMTDVKNGVEFLGITLKRNGITISRHKRDELEERINSIVLEEEGFSEKSLETLQGIKNYYGKLLAPKILQQLDRILCEKLKDLVKKQCLLFPNKKILGECLSLITFFAEENNQKKNSLLAEILSAYTSEKLEKRKGKPKKEKNKLLIERKKKEYQKKEGEGAELVVNTYGCFIGLTNRGISVKLKGKVVHKNPSRALEHITIATKGVTLSSNAIQYCMRNKFPIDFFDASGKHYGSILSPAYMESTLWEKQALMSLERKAYLAVRIIYGKLKNQLNLIKYFHKYHKGIAGVLSEKYKEVCARLEEILDNVKKVNLKDERYVVNLSALESRGAVQYWGYVRLLIADDGVEFESRERKGATDLVNSLLNYGYALLYVRVWEALLGVRLNPMAGVIHLPQAGKPTFVFDIVELFRAQAVDRVVISLIQKGEPLKMKDSLLSEATRKLLVQNILERINRYEKYRGESMKFSKIIYRQVQEIAAYVNEETFYKPYIAKW